MKRRLESGGRRLRTAERLTQRSQQSRMKLRDVARRVVDERAGPEPSVSPQ